MRNPFSRKGQMRDGFPVLPGAFPVLGHIPLLYRQMPKVAEASRGLGPLFWMTAGGMWVLICAGPEGIEFFKSKAFTNNHLKEMAPLISGESLLSQDGPPHRHMRSVVSKPFMPSGLSAKTVGAMSAGLLSGLAERWVRDRRATVLPEIQSVALEIIFRMLGVPAGDIEPWRKQYRDLLLANLNIKLRFPGSPQVRSEKAMVWINARFREIVAEVRRSGDRSTLIGSLVHGQDDDGQPLTDTELLDNLRLIVLGGHETISATMAWMALELAHHPELWDELVEEAKQSDRPPQTPEEARAYPFAEAVFRETVRMHPAFGAITRRSLEPFEIYGRTIPAGTVVGVAIWAVSHDASLFPEPDEMRPARWLDRSGPPSALEIVQFGAGPHFCLGYHMAWLEGVQFAVALAQQAARHHVRPVLRDEDAMRPIYLPTEHPSPKAKIDFR